MYFPIIYEVKKTIHYFKILDFEKYQYLANSAGNYLHFFYAKKSFHLQITI